MKITLEMPAELATLINRLLEAASIYCEAAKQFPPAESIAEVSAPAQPAAPTVAEELPPVVTTEPPQAERPAKAPKAKPAKVKAIVLPDPAVLRQKVAAAEGGFERAKELLAARGKQRMSELTEEELIGYLAELGVAL